MFQQVKINREYLGFSHLFFFFLHYFLCPRYLILCRTIGVGFSSLCARVGGMAAPYIVVREGVILLLIYLHLT